MSEVSCTPWFPTTLPYTSHWMALEFPLSRVGGCQRIAALPRLVSIILIITASKVRYVDRIMSYWMLWQAGWYPQRLGATTTTRPPPLVALHNGVSLILCLYQTNSHLLQFRHHIDSVSNHDIGMTRTHVWLIPLSLTEHFQGAIWQSWTWTNVCFHPDYSFMNTV